MLKNTQTIRSQTNCLSVFDHFLGLALKGLTAMTEYIFFYAGNFVIKKTSLQVLFYEFCEISKNTFFIEHHRKTASIS